jgi:phosphate uptake regulator
MVTDMERIGDSAADIAGKYLFPMTLLEYSDLLTEFRKWQKKAILMVADAVTSFVKLDTALAKMLWNVMMRLTLSLTESNMIWLKR